MTLCWIDCTAGVAGDMLLGALLDAGARLERVRAAVRAVHPDLDVTVERAERHQLACAKATVIDLTSGAAADTTASDDPHDAGHHDPNHHHAYPHRPWREVRRLLDAADLEPRVRERAHATFWALAGAEGAVHGVAPDEVEFHEVGSLDAIGDIVGCCAALVDLGVTRVTASPVTVGHGAQVSGAHGRIPVPGPAVVHLARTAGMPITGGPVAMEAATPTGVALVAAWATAYGGAPVMVPELVGLGAGTRDPAQVANVVRVVLGTPDVDVLGTPDVDVLGTPDVDVRTEPLLVLETNVDDLDPRLWPAALDALLEAGALDAWLTPILMKKGRPAHTLAVLAHPIDRDSLVATMARHTTTLGVRESAVRRHALDRRIDTVDVGGQRVAVKVGLLAGAVVTAQPEFDDCVRAAALLGVPVGEVVARASSAWHA